MMLADVVSLIQERVIIFRFERIFDTAAVLAKRRCDTAAVLAKRRCDTAAVLAKRVYDTAAVLAKRGCVDRRVI